jgi:hypothetical protein
MWSRSAIALVSGLERVTRDRPGMASLEVRRIVAGPGEISDHSGYCDDLSLRACLLTNPPPRGLPGNSPNRSAGAESTAEMYSSRSDVERALSTVSSRPASVKTLSDRSAASSQPGGLYGAESLRRVRPNNRARRTTPDDRRSGVQPRSAPCWCQLALDLAE